MQKLCDFFFLFIIIIQKKDNKGIYGKGHISGSGQHISISESDCVTDEGQPFGEGTEKMLAIYMRKACSNTKSL